MDFAVKKLSTVAVTYFRNRPVYHKAHVGLIDTHAKADGRHDHL
jgi:hypothetical protein